jgi:D-alanyl-D-alanine carboxypeptidase
VQAAPAYDGDINANAVMLLDATTGAVLYEKNADEQIRPASTTKILTCIVALENASLDEVVTVGPEGDWTGSGYSLLNTKNGEKIVMKDLLYGMMLVSGNDAAAAVAVHVGGSEAGFADMMNDTAKRIGMTSSHFVNAHGTDKDDHYVSARDMALLTLYAMKNEAFMDIVGCATYDMPKTNRNSARTVSNTNKLLLKDDSEYYRYTTGIKTGSTPKAFGCLVSSAKKGETQLACLVFGDETEKRTERWPLTRSLFDYGFDNYRTLNVQSVIDSADTISINVENAAEGDDGVLKLSVINTGEEYRTFETGFADSIESSGVKSEIELYSGETLSAPVGEGDAVGIITYRSAETGDIVCQGQLIAARGISSLEEGDSASPSKTDDTEPSGTALPSDRENKDGGGFLVWILVAAAVVLTAVIAVLAITLVRRKKDSKRRRAVRSRR